MPCHQNLWTRRPNRGPDLPGDLRITTLSRVRAQPCRRRAVLRSQVGFVPLRDADHTTRDARPAQCVPYAPRMAADADDLRPDVVEQNARSLEELQASTRDDSKSHVVEVDEAEAAESFELPGADLSDVELAVEVVPEQQNEFTCMSCFLVHHRTQLADANKMICRDCAT